MTKNTLCWVLLLAVVPWMACNEQPDAPAAGTGEFPSTQPQSELQQSVEQIVEGTLTRIDENTDLLWIRAADGSEYAFRYSDMTRVTGAEENVEGLANMSGARLKVWYTSNEGGNTAREIEILSGENSNQSRDPGAGSTRQ